MPLQAFADGAGSGDDICGHAYLESFAGGSDMYKLVIQKELRKDAGYYRYLGPIPSCAGSPDVVWGPNLLSGPCPWNKTESMRESIAEIEIKPGVSPASTAGWFFGCSYVNEVAMSNLDTSKTTDMHQMFANCGGLRAIDVSHLDFSSVVNVNNMFEGCHGLKTVNFSNVHMPKLRHMSGMLYHCSSLKTANFSGFRAPAVDGLCNLFDNCRSLRKVDFSNVDISSAVDAGCAFTDCSSLVSVDFSNANLGKLEDAYEMFYNCSSIVSVSFPHAINAEANAAEMFMNCTALKTASLPWSDISHVGGMFYNCASLTGVSFPEQTIRFGNMENAFKGCLSLESVDLSGVSVAEDSKAYVDGKGNTLTACGEGAFDSSGLKEITVGTGFQSMSALAGLFNLASIWKDEATGAECRTARELLDCIAEAGGAVRFVAASDPRGTFAYEEAKSGTLVLCSERRTLNTAKGEVAVGFAGEGSVPWNSIKPSIKKIRIDSELHPDNITGWFSGCGKLTAISGLENLDTSDVTDMSGLFSGCSSLKRLDLSNLDTRNVTTMQGMLYGCKSLASLVLSGFDTSKVVDMCGMFSHCCSLASLDVSDLDTSKVVDMCCMFDSCRSLKSLDLSGFDTRNVTTMQGMFSDCKSLASLVLSGLDTSKVVDMCSMFDSCRSLKSLDLSGFDTASATIMQSMFAECSELKSLNVSGFDTSGLVDAGSMFRGCTSLTYLDVSGFDSAKMLYVEGMFAECSSLRSIGMFSFDTPPKTWCLSGMFKDCKSLTSIDLSGLKVTEEMSERDFLDMWNWAEQIYGIKSMYSRDRASLNEMLSGCTSLSEVRVSSGLVAMPDLPGGMWSAGGAAYRCDSLPGGRDAVWKRVSNKMHSYALLSDGALTISPMPFEAPGAGDVVYELADSGYKAAGSVPWHGRAADVKSVAVAPTIRLKSVAHLFEGCSSLAFADLSGLDTSEAGDFSAMFWGCSSLRELDLSGIDTRNATAMKRMFHGCRSLERVKLGANFTFRGCAWSRLAGSELPFGAWRQVDSQGTPADTMRAWASDSLPSFTAATYELADEAAVGLTVVSVRGDAEAAREKYTIETTFEQDENGDLVEVESYELDASYDPNVPLVVGESVSASSTKTLSSSTVSKQTLKKLSGNVHSVILGPKVAKVEPEAFAAAGKLTKVTVRSKHLTSKKRVNRCMVGSRASVYIPSTWKKVITAFKKYAWAKPRS